MRRQTENSVQPPDSIPRDVFCPACGYNWRGLRDGRCPECGREFDLARARAGDARAPSSTAMDRTDPWQPHAIAIATLRTMLRFAPRPRQLALTLDLDRPPWAAAAMLFGGTFWIALAQTIALAAVIAWRASCSPFTALAEAAMAWLPATVLWSLPLHLAGGVLIGMDRGLFSRRPRPAHMFHLATHWAAAQGCWHAFAVVAFVALGDPFLEFGPLVCSALAATPSVLMELRVHGAERRSIRCQRALCYGALALAFGLTTSLLGIWPDTIGPMVALRCLF